MRGNANGLPQKHASGLERKNLQPASQRRACLCRVPDTITNSKIANLKELRPGRQSPPPGAGIQKWEPTQSAVRTLTVLVVRSLRRRRSPERPFKVLVLCPGTGDAQPHELVVTGTYHS